MHTTCEERMALRQTPDALQPVAERLFPDNAYLQAEWTRAVGVVRSTTRGWNMDDPEQRQEQRQ